MRDLKRYNVILETDAVNRVKYEGKQLSSYIRHLMDNATESLEVMKQRREIMLKEIKAIEANIELTEVRDNSKIGKKLKAARDYYYNHPWADGEDYKHWKLNNTMRKQNEQEK